MNFSNNVVYQVYPKSFLDTTGTGFGDINGIILKLDYLKELGVDYIWLSPINKSPQHDNGYDISDYYEIDEIFGNKDDYRNLIVEAETRGMKIMLDLVLNHVSSESEWFKKALLGDPKYYNYFIWRDQPNELKSFFSKPAWTYAPEVGKYYLHLFDTHQPDLNWNNPEVRSEIYKMVNYWIDFGVKGFRLDVIDLIGKDPEKLITGKGPKFYEYLHELQNKTFKNDILTVGECWLSTHEDSYKMCSVDGLTEVFHFTEQCLTNGQDKWDQQELDYNKLIDVIKSWHNDYNGEQAKVMNNHDMPRLASLWLNDKEYRYESVTLLGTLYAMFKGTFYLYQGDEIGMINDNKNDIKDYNDVETHNKYEEYKKHSNLSEQEIMDRIKLISRDNSRTPMQWNDSVNGGFTSGSPWLNLNYRYEEINVENDLKSEKSVYKYYQELLKFRKENYEKIISEAIIEITNDNKLITVIKKRTIIFLNMSENERKIEVKGNIILNNYSFFSDNLLPYQVIVVQR